MDLSELRYETWQAVVGDVFAVHTSDGRFDLKLTSAEEQSGPRSGHSYSVVFAGPAEPFLAQRMYTLDHPQLGELAIFLVPVGQADDGFLYEAVFTRLET